MHPRKHPEFHPLHRGQKVLPQKRDYNCLMDSAKELGLEQGLQQGLEQGLQQGLQQGLSQGHQQGSELKLKEITERMLNRGMSPDEIADMIGEDPGSIRILADKIQKSKGNQS